MDMIYGERIMWTLWTFYEKELKIKHIKENLELNVLVGMWKLNWIYLVMQQKLIENDLKVLIHQS